MTHKILILGAGNNPHKRLRDDCATFYDARSVSPAQTYNKVAPDVHTLDMDASTKPTVIWDLNERPWPVKWHSYDEIHAYEVLEHFGAQGDFIAFFAHFDQIWYALKPDGLLYASVPTGPWTWGDPGHTRSITLETLTFLFRSEYEKQVGKTSMTDYRSYLVGDWELAKYHQNSDGLRFILRAKK